MTEASLPQHLPGDPLLLTPLLSAPLLLAFDTCGPNGSVVLARAGVVETKPAFEALGHAELAGRSYSSQLVSAIRDLLARNAVPLEHVAAIAVTNGPGSFTGVRVGLSTAKGLAEAASIPVIALSRLAILAQLSGSQNVLAVFNAGRGEYYAGEYRAGSAPREMLLAEDEVSAAVAKGLQLAVCEDRAAERLAALAPLRTESPTAVDALRLALDRFHRKEFDDIELLDANYLRRSDAELFARPHPAPTR